MVKMKLSVGVGDSLRVSALQADDRTDERFFCLGVNYTSDDALSLGGSGGYQQHGGCYSPL